MRRAAVDPAMRCAAAEEIPLAAGQTESCHEALGDLGTGAMGEVYRAKGTRLGREVAIEVLRENVETDAGRVRRFDRGAQTLATFDHPHVAGSHGADRIRTRTFVAMELRRAASRPRRERPHSA